MVGKLQWMTYTRPDISFAAKELARALTSPTTADQQKQKNLLRYMRNPTLQTERETNNQDIKDRNSR